MPFNESGFIWMASGCWNIWLVKVQYDKSVLPSSVFDVAVLEWNLLSMGQTASIKLTGRLTKNAVLSSRINPVPTAD